MSPLAVRRYPSPASLSPSPSSTPSTSPSQLSHVKLTKSHANERLKMRSGQQNPYSDTDYALNANDAPFHPSRQTYTVLPPPPQDFQHGSGQGRAQPAAGGYSQAFDYRERRDSHQMGGGFSGGRDSAGAAAWQQEQRDPQGAGGQQYWYAQEHESFLRSSATPPPEGMQGRWQKGQDGLPVFAFYDWVSRTYGYGYRRDYSQGQTQAQRYDSHNAPGQAQQLLSFRHGDNLTLPAWQNHEQHQLTQNFSANVQSAGSHLNAHASAFTPPPPPPPEHGYYTRAAAEHAASPALTKNDKGLLSRALPSFATATSAELAATIKAPQKSKRKKNKNNNKAPAPQVAPQQAHLRPFELAALRVSPTAATKAHQERNKKQNTIRSQVMERPVPSDWYIDATSQPSQLLSEPQRLLVVLDLNGTLLLRKRFTGNNTFIARPHLAEFLNYLFANHRVMIWSSAKPENVATMCKQLFSSAELELLAGLWARDTLRIPDQYYDQKVQVHKQLTWLWNETKVQASSRGGDMWSYNNTVLIDDSIEKAASEPHNLIEIEEFEARDDQMKTNVLGQVQMYLEQLRYQSNVASFMRVQPFRYDASLDA